MSTTTTKKTTPKKTAAKSTTAKSTTAKSTTAKKTTAKSTVAKKASTKKATSGRTTATSSGSGMKVSQTEKRLVELYRKADSDTKKAVMNLLKGESPKAEDIVSSLLGAVISSVTGQS